MSHIISYSNIASELQDLELTKKSGSKFVKFDKWINLTPATLSYGYGISIIPSHYLQAVLALINDGILCLVWEVSYWEKIDGIRIKILI